MKYSDHPMPLVEGEYPWEREHYFENGAWKERWVQIEEKDIPPDAGPEDHGTFYIENGNEEYWDRETVCKNCGTRFMAYVSIDGDSWPKYVRNYCPGCGRRLTASERTEDGANAG